MTIENGISNSTADNLSVVLHKAGDLRLENTSFPDPLGKNGKSNGQSTA